MPVTVGVNQLAVLHKGSQGVTIAFPDVCKTPTPAGPVPIAYPNIVTSAAGKTGGAKGVKVSPAASATKGSKYASSMGDEAARGTGYGVVSGKVATPECPAGVRVHQTKAEAVNVARHLEARRGPAAPAPPGPGPAAPSDIRRALILHALAKQP